MASPQVRTVEYDLSQVLPAFEGMSGLIIGNFDKGPLETRMFLSRQTQCDQVLGKPGPNSDQAYFILHSYLTKSQRCWVVRVADDALFGGVILGSGFNTTIGTGDGATLVFTGTTSFSRCIPGLLEIWMDGVKIGYDVSTTGAIAGTNLTGTVTYETGAVSLTFAAGYAPLTNSTIYARWGFPVLDFDAIDVDAAVYIDPTDYDWVTRDIELTIADPDTTGLYTDALPPFPIYPPAVAPTGVADATVVFYDGTTAIFYADENGTLVDTGAYLDSGTVNYTTGAVSFTLDALYTPTSDITVIYHSNLADCAVVYADSEGDWSDDVAITLSNIDILANSWRINLWEREIINGVSTIEALHENDWTVSREEKVDGFNRQLYLEDKINDNSYYMRVFDNPTTALLDTVGPVGTYSHASVSAAATDLKYMTGGDDGDAVTPASYVVALNLFDNKEDINIDIITDTLGVAAYQVAIANISDRTRGGRGDCYGILYTPLALEASTNYVAQLLEYVKYSLNLNTSFCGLYCGHVKITDTYNGREIWIPPSGFVSAAFSYTADMFDPWWAAAGWRRGVLPVLDLYRKFTLGERDVLYDANINCMKFKPGKGIAIWGQRTLYGINSALRSANVRWLLIVIEDAAETFLEDYVFEFNDAKTRALIRSAMMSYLETIRLRRGLYSYDVVCDDTNNTSNDIDNLRMNVDTYVQPTKVAETIYNRVIITRTGVDFGDVRIV